MKNPKSDSYYFSFITWSGKATIDPLMPGVDESRNEFVGVDKAPKTYLKSWWLVKNHQKKSIGVNKSIKKDKGKGKVVKPMLKTILWTPPLFFLEIKEETWERELSEVPVDIERTVS